MFIPNKRGKTYKIPVIFEFGQLNTRAGFAGKDSPDVILPSDYLSDADGSQFKFCDYDCSFSFEGYDLKNFVKDGLSSLFYLPTLVTDIDLCREYIDYICTNHLMVDKNCPFFMIESIQNKKENRYKLIEMLFDDLAFSSVFFHRS
jgi:actin-like protein 6A